MHAFAWVYEYLPEDMRLAVCTSVCVCVVVLPVILMMRDERSQLDANSHVKNARQEVSGRRLTSLQ